MTIGYQRLHVMEPVAHRRAPCQGGRSNVADLALADEDDLMTTETGRQRRW